MYRVCIDRKEIAMKFAVCILVLVTFCVGNVSGQISIVEVKGDVTVLRGVNDEWTPLRRGEMLKPDDSMKLGRRSSAAILVDGKRITLPERTIVDLSDFRQLTRDELLLRLAMERVREVPDDSDRDGLRFPQATSIHGTEKSADQSVERSKEIGEMQLNGARLLYTGGYYATCVLRTKEVLRLHPIFANKTDVRLMVASALEKTNLYGEALTEYIALDNSDLTPAEKAHVRMKIERLKKKS